MSRMWRWAVVLVFVLGCAGSAEQDWTPFGKTPDERLVGSWANESTGHIVTFSGTGWVVRHVTDESCVMDNGVVPDYALYRLAPDGERLELVYFDYRSRPALLQAPQVFNPVPSAPRACTTSETRVEPGRVVELAIELVDRFYAFFPERGLDWAPMRERALERAGSAPDDSTAFEILAEALGPMNDGHVNLSGAGRTFNAGSPQLRQRLAEAWRSSGESDTEGAFVSSWHRGIQASVYPLLRGGEARSGAAGAIEWGWLADSVAYLRINRFNDFTEASTPRPVQMDSLAAAVGAAKADLSTARAWIVDVALNGGGSDAAALLVASHFADEPRTVLHYQARGAPDQQLDMTPMGAPETRPILLLTSEVTASAAESFVLMMRALPHVRHVGETTRGGLSSMLPKPLPNGFRITLSYQRVLDHRGQLFEGTGIRPDCPIALFPDDDLHGRFAEAVLGLATGAECAVAP